MSRWVAARSAPGVFATDVIRTSATAPRQPYRRAAPSGGRFTHQRDSRSTRPPAEGTVMRCRTHFTAILLTGAIGVSGAAGAIAPQAMPGPTRADASAVLHADRVPLGTLARDMLAFASAISAIEDDLQAGLEEASAAQDPSPLRARVPGLRAQVAALQEVASRMAGYRVANADFERRRAGMAREAPAYAAVVTRLLDAVEADDAGGFVAAIEQYPVRAIAVVRAAQGTPNVPAARYRRDARALTGSLTRMNRIVRSPTKAGMPVPTRATCTQRASARTGSLARYAGSRPGSSDARSDRLGARWRV